MSREPGPPGPNTTLHHYPWIVVRFACTACRVHANVRLAVLVERCGATATIEHLLSEFHKNCPHRPRKRNGRTMCRERPCGGYSPDLGSTRPPDLPPSLSGLTLIDGGKGDMLTAEEERITERRRIGGPNE